MALCTESTQAHAAARAAGLAPGLGIGQLWAAYTRGLAALPPFWATVIYTVALSLPQAILAAPIAVAVAGPLRGLGLLLAIGALNVITMTAMAEVVVRSSTAREGHVFIGRLVAGLLGPVGSVVITAATATLFFLALIASLLGLGATLAQFTDLPAEAWAALSFLVGAALVARNRTSFAVTLTVLLAGANVALILILSLLALRHGHPSNLAAGRATGHGAAAAVGVLLILYFAQALAVQIYPLVQARDPGGRAFVRGSAVGTVMSTVLFAGWAIAVTSAVAPKVLAAQSGTALVPLARVIGPVGSVLGSALVTLLLGLTALRCMHVLHHLVRERLPKGRPDLGPSRPAASVVLLPRRTSLGAGAAADIRSHRRHWSGAPAARRQSRLVGCLLERPRVRTLVTLLPSALASLVAERLLLSGAASFSSLLAFTGVITVTLIGGIFPLLLLLAARRRGGRAIAPALRGLSSPPVVTAICALLLGNVLYQGLVVWQSAAARLCALAVVGATSLMILMLRRSGAFVPRVVAARSSHGAACPGQ